MTTTYAPPSLLEVAVRYGRMGYPVFPLAPGNKIPLQGVRWREEATGNEEKIRAWWEANPSANIAMPTGQASGILVLDVDGEEGRASLRRLEAEHGPLPLTHMVMTPRGKHLYFRWQPGLTNSAGKLGKGLDVRGEGGYVIMSPSKRPEGAYRSKRLGYDPIADPPRWLIDLLTPKVKALPEVQPLRTERYTPSHSDAPRSDDPRRAKAAETCLQRASELEEGERNDGTFRWACALRKVATSEEEWQGYRERLLDVLPYGPGINGEFTEEEAERTVANAEARQPLGEWEPESPLVEAKPKPSKKRCDAAHVERRVREALLEAVGMHGWTYGVRRIAQQASIPRGTFRNGIKRIADDGQVYLEPKLKGKRREGDGILLLVEHLAWSGYEKAHALALSKAYQQVRMRKGPPLSYRQWDKPGSYEPGLRRGPEGPRESSSLVSPSTVIKSDYTLGDRTPTKN